MSAGMSLSAGAKEGRRETLYAAIAPDTAIVNNCRKMLSIF